MEMTATENEGRTNPQKRTRPALCQWCLAAGCAFLLVVPTLIRGGPSDPRSDQSSEVSEQLIKVRSMQEAGDHSGAREWLLEILRKTPNLPSVLDSLGSVEQDSGNYLDAERAYRKGLSLSAESGDNAERVALLTNLATLYLDTNQYSKGEQIGEELKKLQRETLNAQPAAAGKLLNVIGSLEHVSGRDDQAEQYFSQSVVLLRQAGSAARVDAALVEANIAFLRLEARRYEAGAAILSQVIGEIESASTSENPALIRPLIDFARCESRSAQANEAEVSARRAVMLSTKTYGQAHLLTATAMREQANALRHLGQKSEARELEKKVRAYLDIHGQGPLSRFSVSVRELKAAAVH